MISLIAVDYTLSSSHWYVLAASSDERVVPGSTKPAVAAVVARHRSPHQDVAQRALNDSNNHSLVLQTPCNAKGMKL